MNYTDYTKYIGKKAKLYNKHAYVEGTINDDGNIYISDVRYTDFRYSHMRRYGNWELQWNLNGIDPIFHWFIEDKFSLLVDEELIFSSYEDIFEAIK